MNYYTQIKINSYTQLAAIHKKAHLAGVPFGFYFDCFNRVRLFSDNTDFLQQFSDVNTVPETKRFIKCTRVRAMERTTPRQQQKRIEKLKAHLAKKGIDYKQEERTQKRINYSYYIDVFSLSSKSTFRLYVRNSIVFKPCPGEFSSYGLSKNGATLPLF